jgi:hypothetical protein
MGVLQDYYTSSLATLPFYYLDKKEAAVQSASCAAALSVCTL